MRTHTRLLLATVAAGVAIACEAPPPSNALTASGNVEATEVQVAAEVGGRIVELRVDEGDRIKVTFTNAGSHPHTIHFHGWHPPAVDGSLPGQEVRPGQKFVYEFDADPFGLHLYHCHTVPLKRHIH